MLEMMWRKGTLLRCWWECKLVQTLWRIVRRFLNKLKIELPYDSTIPLLGIYPKKTIIQEDAFTSVFTTALSAICCVFVHPSRNPPNREDRGAPPAFMISGAHRAPGPASCLLCWREAVRHDRRLLGPLPSGQVSSLLMETPGAS